MRCNTTRRLGSSSTCLMLAEVAIQAAAGELQQQERQPEDRDIQRRTVLTGPGKLGEYRAEHDEGLGVGKPGQQPFAKQVARSFHVTDPVDHHAAAGPLFVGEVKDIRHAHHLDCLRDDRVALDQLGKAHGKDQDRYQVRHTRADLRRDRMAQAVAQAQAQQHQGHGAGAERHGCAKQQEVQKRRKG